ncbi:prolyl oligopeptidase family serine peptidase [Paenibacillus sp. y28]|uniref:carboxylesterase family protein n=1 Tax=Paenibacillus sp. y28 TaxID=3129110 RepID=UPI00301A86AE
MPVRKVYGRQEADGQGALGYQLFLPIDYEAEPEKRWPVILFLHGIKKRGSNLGDLDGYGLLGIAEETPGFGFVVIVPQCPAESSWPKERASVLALLDSVQQHYRTDAKQVLLTGFSMGGNGVWDLADYASDRFAAAAPLAGYYDADRASLFGDMPIWTFHGEADDVVPVQRTQDVVAALQLAGKNVRCTLLPELKHPIMDAVYRDPALFEWFLEQVKPECSSHRPEGHSE